MKFLNDFNNNGQIKSLFTRCAESISNIFISDEKIVSAGIADCYKHFIGLYEPIYQISIGNMRNKTNTFGEWQLRIVNLGEPTEFSRRFSKKFAKYENWNDDEYQKNAKYLLSIFAKAGIQRDSRTEFVADENIDLFYSTLDGRDIQPGETVHVLRGNWTLADKILDLGVLE